MKRGIKFSIIALVALLMLCMAALLVACNGGNSDNSNNESQSKHRHKESDWIIDVEPTCGEVGHKHTECVTCHAHHLVEEIPATGQHEIDPITKKCKMCQKADFITGDKLYFGEYPQAKVEDNGITATLAQMSGDRPVKGNSGMWTDYGYYIKGRMSEYMWYIDLEYQDAKYRGVYFTSYRPYNMDVVNRFISQDENGYNINTLYWFKWEPIEWRVLENKNGEVFVMSNIILDSQQYYYGQDGTRNIDGKTVYPNNYKESDIRAWLNGTFYDWAFDTVDKTIIKTTLVDNSASTTSSSSNQYACENTNDKVFLLSYKDVSDLQYGLDNSDYDTERRLDITDYARSQGVWAWTSTNGLNVGSWWLRSPSDFNDEFALNVTDGNINDYNDVGYTYCGVVPAIKITLGPSTAPPRY